jgi:aminoglycoside 6'-N-acetyltransferase I
MSNITYRKAIDKDITVITQIAILLYDEHTFEEIFEENKELLVDKNQAMFLSLDGDKAIGFSHCSLRNDYVEGTHGGTVGYLEGVYVLPEYRKKGVAKTLVDHCERWVKEKGCKEFASDCQLNNDGSYAFHMRIGFKEVNRMICFTKEVKM